LEREATLPSLQHLEALGIQQWEQNTDPFLPQNTQGVMMVLAARSLSDMASRWVRWWIYD